MLLMVKKGIRREISHTVHRYVKANNKFMKHNDKNRESSHLKYWDVNNFYRWEMPKKLPANGFK